ncbi:MAG: type II toxin-antitoxin system RelB/DinJ family antitoxin [Nanoarchaeota archaeon]|jgi:DNA-damage-inducible protein J|nr:type II toxin-antitoxin system RelB/DinJ family antitoxin [Nanoarchaeota archaeon]
MSTTNISIRMDEDLKRDAETLFSDLGLNMTTAFTVFVKQAVREQRIPFIISRDFPPNKETLEAFAEGDKMLNDSNSKKFPNVASLFEELNS